MNPVWIIVKRELGSFFNSLIGYILIGAFLAAVGFFTWIYGFGNDVFSLGQAFMTPFTYFSYFILVIFIPALTMRLIAEERKEGTIELLLTKAVTNRQLVTGKFLACWIMIGIALLFTLPYYISVSLLGDLDHGVTWCGYIALMLMSAAYIGIGIYMSSITDNQIVAFLLTFLVGLFLMVVLFFASMSQSGFLADSLYYFSFYYHFEPMTRGVIDLASVLYFGFYAVVGILLAEWNISKR